MLAKMKQIFILFEFQLCAFADSFRDYLQASASMTEHTSA